MTESEHYKPVPLEQRPSQNLGWKEYLVDYFKPLLTPIVTTLAGYFIGKQFAPPEFEKRATTGVGQFFQSYMAGLYADQKDRSQAYAIMGLKVGVLYTAYNVWKKHTVTDLALGETVEKIKQIEPMQATQAALAKENQLLEKMIAHEQKKQEAALHPEKASSQYRDLVNGEKTPEITSLHR